MPSLLTPVKKVAMLWQPFNKLGRHMKKLREKTLTSFGIRTNIPSRQLNLASGLEPRLSTKRTTALSGFFVCGAQLYPSMVGRAGELKSSPGSLLTGSSNPVRLTTSMRLEPLGGDSSFNKGVQP